MWSYLILGAGFAVAAVAQPGPFQTYLLSETLVRGWRRTWPAAFAPLLSDIPVLIVSLLLLSQIPETMIRFLHLAGAVFLLYLARGAWSSWRSARGDRPVVPVTGRNTLLKAAFVNLLNPNPWLGWSLVLGPVFLTGYREAPAKGVALIAGFYGTMVSGTIGLILLFAFARRLGPGVQRIGSGLSVLALAGFGLYQLWLGMRDWFPHA